MAIYHCSFKIIGRTRSGSAAAASAYVSGSVVAGAAYRAGERLKSEYDGKEHDYTAKEGVVHSEIVLPKEAPEEYYDREALWNAVELKNIRKDAQLARECDMALPRELSREEQIELVREYIRETFTYKGVCADFAIHDKGDGNPHTHIMLTIDSVSKDGFGTRLPEEKSTNFYSQVRRLKQWREEWAKVTNRYLADKGTEERIDHRSYAEQGIDKIPTIHLGKEAHQLEKRGIHTEKGDENRRIARLNANIEELGKQQGADGPDVRQKIEQLSECLTDREKVKHNTGSNELNVSFGRHGEAKYRLWRASMEIRKIEGIIAKIRPMEKGMADDILEKLDNRLNVWKRHRESLLKQDKERHHPKQVRAIVSELERIKSKYISLAREADTIERGEARYLNNWEHVESIETRLADITATKDKIQTYDRQERELRQAYRDTGTFQIAQKAGIIKQLADIKNQKSAIRADLKEQQGLDIEQLETTTAQLKNELQDWYAKRDGVRRLPELKTKLRDISMEYKKQRLPVEQKIGYDELNEILIAKIPSQKGTERDWSIYAYNKLNIISAKEYEQITGKPREPEVPYIAREYEQELERYQGRERVKGGDW